MIFSSKSIGKIGKNQKILEKKLKVKLHISGNEVEMKGKQLDVYIGDRVLEAIEKNFAIKTALLLTNEDYLLEDIAIKSVTSRKKIERIRARIIGTKGKTLKTISELTNCHITLNDNTVSIICPAENIKQATSAIENLIRGGKQSNVYIYLKKAIEDKEIEDLGLKE